jgi:hypothetical protein
MKTFPLLRHLLDETVAMAGPGLHGRTGEVGRALLNCRAMWTLLCLKWGMLLRLMQAILFCPDPHTTPMHHIHIGVHLVKPRYGPTLFE